MPRPLLPTQRSPAQFAPPGELGSVPILLNFARVAITIADVRVEIFALGKSLAHAAEGFFGHTVIPIAPARDELQFQAALHRVVVIGTDDARGHVSQTNSGRSKFPRCRKRPTTTAFPGRTCGRATSR